jgi:hypothetical protein
MENDARLQPLLDQFQEIVPKIRAESDRATAILSVSYLDDLLRRLLEAVLVDDPISRELFDAYAPLNTLRGRIDMGFAFGLFQKSIHRELSLIRKIRNAFAHDLNAHSFDQAPMRDQCRQLHVMRMKIGLSRPPGDTSSDERTAFFLSVVSLAMELHAAITTATRRTPGRIEGSLYE